MLRFALLYVMFLLKVGQSACPIHLPHPLGLLFDICERRGIRTIAHPCFQAFALPIPRERATQKAHADMLYCIRYECSHISHGRHVAACLT